VNGRSVFLAFWGACAGNSKVGPTQAIDESPFTKGTWIGWLVCVHKVGLSGWLQSISAAMSVPHGLLFCAEKNKHRRIGPPTLPEPQKNI
jgi:hypothetical protein